MTDQQRQDIIEEFIQFCKQELNIRELPIMEFTNDREWAVERKSFGQYNPESGHLEVYIGNRNLADILRTLGHELVHHRQRELNMIKPDSGKTGSYIENQANALAGMMMRDFGKDHDMIYEHLMPTLKQIYEVDNSRKLQIYCDMDGVLCDFDERFEHFYGVLPREYYTQKGAKPFEDAVNEAGIEFWSKMKWMPGGRELWSIIGKYNPIILTSPSKFKYAKQGKIEWIENHLNPQPKKILFGQTGDKHSKMETDPKNSMLIDDYWPNLAPWKALGGISIMHKDINKTKDILSKFRISENIQSITENEEVFVTGLVNGLENLKGKVPPGFKDRRATYSQSSEDVYYTEDIVGDKKIFSIVDRRTADDFGRPGFISVSISVDKDSDITLNSVRVKLQLMLTRIKAGGAIDKNTGKIDKYKLSTLDI